MARLIVGRLLAALPILALVATLFVVRDLARRSRIAAVKRVRELTNSSLRAAKEYVDRLP